MAVLSQAVGHEMTGLWPLLSSSQLVEKQTMATPVIRKETKNWTFGRMYASTDREGQGKLLMGCVHEYVQTSVL
jgi:hypothetical protein